MRQRLLMLLLFLLPFSGLFASTDPTALELRALVDQLFESVGDGDMISVDEMTCLDDLVHAQLRREEALGLIRDAGAPELLEERKAKARTETRAFVERLLAKGQQIELVDVARIARIEASGDDGEVLIGVGEESLEITGTGILELKMLTIGRRVDIGVVRLRGEWCLDPMSMH